MTCEVFNILARDNFHLPDFDGHKSFTLGPSRPAPSNIVVNEPGWTLFSFDVKRSQAVFLDHCVGVDLSKVPFCYLAQYERARRMALMPFSDLLALAEKIPDPKSTVQLFNIGHCGSTLLHHVFNRAPGVWCISEPIWFFNLAMARHNIDPATMQLMMRAGMRFLMLFEGAAKAEMIVVKQFSQLTTLFKAMHDAVPNTKSMFLYRDGKSWPNSFYHFLQKIGLGMVVPRDKRDFQWWMMSGNSPQSELEGVVDLHAEVMTFDRVAGAAWVLHTREYLQAIKNGVPMMAVRYNELNQDRVKTIGKTFAYLGIASDLAAATLEAFDEDSHQGTRTARDKSELNFTEENYARLTEIYANPRIALDPDMILPDST
jgi:Sulfotransferase domain